MKAFAELYAELDAATSTRHKSEALQKHFRAAIADETRRASAAWSVYMLAGGKPRQLVPNRLLWALALEATGLPEWLLAESYENVGDMAETLSLLLPPPEREEDVALDVWMNQRFASLRPLDDAEKMTRLRTWVGETPQAQRLALFKLVTSALRIGVSKLQVVQALALASGVEAKAMAQRMMGYTQAGRTPTSADFSALVAPEMAGGDASGQPYPFFLAHSFQGPIEAMADRLGPPSDWLIEWKFDGIRAQCIRRGGEWRIWSRGEELVTDSYPDLAPLADALPDGTVLDGELVVVRESGGRRERPDVVDDIAPFASLQRRLGRKVLGAKLLRELPVALIAYDLLEENGEDIRALPQIERRRRLERLVERIWARATGLGVALPLRLSPAHTAPDWPTLYDLRETARALGAEGMMLKSRRAEYGVGRRKSAVDGGDGWWKWKLDPMSVDAVLIYAQRGHGRRSGVFSDYTFAVWTAPPEDGDRLLTPFAKAYSGLSDEEMRQVDARIRETTVETFGPVRSVRPTMVFELGFEGIGRSTRHKSGIAVRFPRMLRWRHDKPVEEADTLEQLRALLPADEAPS